MPQVKQVSKPAKSATETAAPCKPMYLIGTDEAGYGPNLGPLVIAASVWSVERSIAAEQLDELVQSCIARELPPAKHRDDRLVIADSKQLFNPARGIELLERHVLRALELGGMSPRSWRELWQGFHREDAATLDAAPWHDDYDEPLPTTSQHLEAPATSLDQKLADCGVRLVHVQVRTVFPAEFNRLLDVTDNKSQVLSQLSLELLCRSLALLPDGDVVATCDKHGGRNRYGALLQPLVNDWVEVVRESAEESAYRWGDNPRRVELRLRPRCEAMLPTALASMVAKYLRELAMRAFNHFWRQHLPELKPTAGYPLDAKRFKQEIAATQRELGIDDAILWRRK